MALVPSLSEIQEAINEVALHVILSTKQISMWGASASERAREHELEQEERDMRSMHVHIAKDRLIVKQLVMLAGGVEVLKNLA